MALIDGLVSYWKLDEVSGDVLDAHGSNNGTNHGATPNVGGKINTAYDFDGTNDYVTLPSGHFGITNMNQEFSINLWFNSIKNSAYQRLYEYNTGGTGKFVIQKWGTADTDKMRFFSIGGTTISISSNDAITSAGWHMYTITHDGSLYRMYIDGVVQADTVGTKTLTLSDSTATYGSRSNTPTPSETFGGRLDELGFWTRDLNQTEITALYNNNDGLAYPFTVALAEGYLEILGVTAPTEAHTGDEIPFTIHTQNTGAGDDFMVELSGGMIGSSEFYLGEGLTQDVPFSFIMPDNDVSIIIKTYHWDVEKVGWVWDVTSVWDVNAWQ